MKKFIANHATYTDCGNPSHETFTLPSKTIPGQSMGLEEMLRRFTRGGEVRTFEPVYLGDDPVPEIEKMTPMERLDYARQLKKQIHDVQHAEPVPPTVSPDPVTPPVEPVEPDKNVK